MTDAPARGRWRSAVTVIALLAATGLVVLVVARDTDRAGGAAVEVPATATAVVERATLVDQATFDGIVGHGPVRPVGARASGTVTAVAAEGVVLQPGDTPFAVDGRPVTLLDGEVPAYRRLGAGVADGADIAQLERSLITLGHGGDDLTEPDDEWDGATTRAVRRWQEAVGLEEDGVVDDGEVVFAPTPARVASSVVVGEPATPGATVVEVTSAVPVVTIELASDRRSQVAVGRPAAVTLPDGGSVAGTIFAVDEADGAAGADGTPEGDDPVVIVTVVVGAADLGTDPEGLPVEVTVPGERREGVLVVPVVALVGRPDGGLAVEVVATGGSSLVPVDVGLVVGGRAEVDGALVAGDEVVVPA